MLFLGNKTAGNCKDFVLEKGGCSSAVTKVLNSGCAWKWKSIGVPGGPLDIGNRDFTQVCFLSFCLLTWISWGYAVYGQVGLPLWSPSDVLGKSGSPCPAFPDSCTPSLATRGGTLCLGYSWPCLHFVGQVCLRFTEHRACPQVSPSCYF